ncbi:MAG: glycosyltransferase family 2 protein [Cyanobacteria bacterium P01_D01_bin.105]
MESSKFWILRTRWVAIKHVLRKVIRALKTVKQRGPGYLYYSLRQRVSLQKEYGSDIAYEYYNRHCMSELEARRAKEGVSKLSYQPLFSIVMPVYNVEGRWLEKAIESVMRQIYPNWELCISDDASTQPHIRPLLTRYAEQDSRIKVHFCDSNGGISTASNAALEMASGEYIALLDNDDELTPQALYENAKLLNRHPEADFIYSDEDKIDTVGHCRDPFFKPDWSPDYMHACMYTCHLGVYRTQLLREIGGFRSDYDGAQDYDLVLRVADKTDRIFHISKILYHWRIIPSSMAANIGAKSWAYQAAHKALQAMVDRSEYSGWVEDCSALGFYRVRRDIDHDPLVSIVIPSAGSMVQSNGRDVCLLTQCINSIRAVSSYHNIEIVVVDGFDISDDVISQINSEDEDAFRLVRCDRPFNFSERMNLGVRAAKGDFLLMLNDDTEVLTPNWIESLLEFAQQQEIGAVGAKLLYPNGLLQHAGIVILSGEPTHAFHQIEGHHQGYYGCNAVNRNCIGVTGACLMMRREVFEEIGGFDEDFPLNFNDVDLCLRIHQAGYRNVFTPYAELLHHESVSRGGEFDPVQLTKLQRKFEKTHYMRYDPYYNRNLSTRRPYFEIALPSE